MEQQFARPGGLSALLRVVQFIPYVAIGLLVIMIAIWVIFGIKKFRWAKILAIVLTVLVLITGVCSFIPYLFRASMRGQFPEGEFPRDEFQEGEFPRRDSGRNSEIKVPEREDEELNTRAGFYLLLLNCTKDANYPGEMIII